MKKNFPVFMIVLLMGSMATYLPAEVNGTGKNTVVRVGLLAPSLGFETKLSRSFSLRAMGGIHYSIDDKAFVPWLETGFRYYYNMTRRHKNNKRVENFSADYLGTQSQYVFSTDNVSRSFYSGVCWGMQRNIGRRFYYDFSLGFGTLFKNQDTSARGTISFSLGLTL